MSKISEIFDLLDYQAAEKKAAAPSRQYAMDEKRKINKPKRARFKMQVYYWDGNKRYFYSLDMITRGGEIHIDEHEGLKWLLKEVNRTRDKIKTCTIYANPDPEPLTKGYNYNTRVVTMSPKYKINYSNVQSHIKGADVFCQVNPLIKHVIKPRTDL